MHTFAVSRRRAERSETPTGPDQAAALVARLPPMRHTEWGQSATDTSSRRTRARGVATPLTPCVLRGCAPRLCPSGSANSHGADLSSGAGLGVTYGLIRGQECSTRESTCPVSFLLAASLLRAGSVGRCAMGLWMRPLAQRGIVGQNEEASLHAQALRGPIWHSGRDGPAHMTGNAIGYDSSGILTASC
jgi:hypothetical protein